MTCIVGLVEAGTVHMGGDSASVGGLSLTTRRDPKVFRRPSAAQAVPEILIGFTSSWRMGSILRYSLEVPAFQGQDIVQWMHTAFIDAVRKALKSGGYAKVDDNVESGGWFLVGVQERPYEGRLFVVGNDFQVGEGVNPYAAVGCGEDVALGSLHTTQALNNPPIPRLRMALEAAEQYSAGVRAPFVFESLPRRGETRAV